MLLSMFVYHEKYGYKIKITVSAPVRIKILLYKTKEQDVLCSRWMVFQRLLRLQHIFSFRLDSP